MSNLYVYGTGECDELGVKTKEDETELKTPGNIEILNIPPHIRICQISCGSQFTLALTEEGRVFSWGSNDESQLGRGGNNMYPGKIRFLLPDGVTDCRISNVSSGDSFAVAYNKYSTPNYLFYWGLFRTDNGPVGDSIPKPTLYPIDNLSPNFQIEKVTTGFYYTLILSKDMQNLYAFGLDVFGETGKPLRTSDELLNELEENSATNNHINNFRKIDLNLQSNENLIDIFTGGHHNFALIKRQILPDKSINILKGWGKNVYGQLGIGNVDYTNVPTEVKFKEMDNKSNNIRTNLINKITYDQEEPRKSGPSLYNVQALSPPDNNNINNNSQNLNQSNDGFPNLTQIISPQLPNITQVELNNDAVSFKSVALGTEHTIAFTTDNKVYAWGNNRDYQCAQITERDFCKENNMEFRNNVDIYSTHDYYVYPTLIPFFNDIHIDKILARGDFSYVVNQEKVNLYCWGSAGNSSILGQENGTKELLKTPFKLRDSFFGDKYLHDMSLGECFAVVGLIDKGSESIPELDIDAVTRNGEKVQEEINDNQDSDAKFFKPIIRRHPGVAEVDMFHSKKKEEENINNNNININDSNNNDNNNNINPNSEPKPMIVDENPNEINIENNSQKQLSKTSSPCKDIFQVISNKSSENKIGSSNKINIPILPVQPVISSTGSKKNYIFNVNQDSNSNINNNLINNSSQKNNDINIINNNNVNNNNDINNPKPEDLTLEEKLNLASEAPAKKIPGGQISKTIDEMVNITGSKKATFSISKKSKNSAISSIKSNKISSVKNSAKNSVISIQEVKGPDTINQITITHTKSKRGTSSKKQKEDQNLNNNQCEEKGIENLNEQNDQNLNVNQQINNDDNDNVVMAEPNENIQIIQSQSQKNKNNSSKKSIKSIKSNKSNKNKESDSKNKNNISLNNESDEPIGEPMEVDEDISPNKRRHPNKEPTPKLINKKQITKKSKEHSSSKSSNKKQSKNKEENIEISDEEEKQENINKKEKRSKSKEKKEKKETRSKSKEKKSKSKGKNEVPISIEDDEENDNEESKKDKKTKTKKNNKKKVEKNEVIDDGEEGDNEESKKDKGIKNKKNYKKKAEKEDVIDDGEEGDKEDEEDYDKKNKEVNANKRTKANQNKRNKSRMKKSKSPVNAPKNTKRYQKKLFFQEEEEVIEISKEKKRKTKKESDENKEDIINIEEEEEEIIEKPQKKKTAKKTKSKNQRNKTKSVKRTKTAKKKKEDEVDEDEDEKSDKEEDEEDNKENNIVKNKKNKRTKKDTNNIKPVKIDEEEDSNDEGEKKKGKNKKKKDSRKKDYSEDDDEKENKDNDEEEEAVKEKMKKGRSKSPIGNNKKTKRSKSRKHK